MTDYIPACQSIQKILYTYQEFKIIEDWTQEWLDEIDSIYEVLLEFQDGTYMEIQQVRDYSIQDVVGDIGGYLGLFLGFAILQIPELIFRIYFWIDGVLSKKQLSINPISEKLQTQEANECNANCSTEALNRKIDQNVADIDTMKRTLDEIRAQIYRLST